MKFANILSVYLPFVTVREITKHFQKENNLISEKRIEKVINNPKMMTLQEIKIFTKLLNISLKAENLLPYDLVKKYGCGTSVLTEKEIIMICEQKTLNQ